MRIHGNETTRLAEAFAALGHPVRLAIVRLLMRRPMCVVRIAVALDLPQPTVSRNLAVLRHAGLVTRRRFCGQFVRYALADELDGVPLEPLYGLVAQLVPDLYDEEKVEAELRRRGIRTPAAAE